MIIYIYNRNSMVISLCLLMIFVLCKGNDINKVYSSDYSFNSLGSFSKSIKFNPSILLLSDISNERKSLVSNHPENSNNPIFSYQSIISHFSNKESFNFYNPSSSINNDFLSYKSFDFNSNSHDKSIYNNFSFSYISKNDDIIDVKVFDIEIDMNIKDETIESFDSKKQFTLRYVFSELLFRPIETVEIMAIHNIDLNSGTILDIIHKMDTQYGINVFMITRFTSDYIVNDVINKINEIFINGTLVSKLNEYGMIIDLTLNSVGLYDSSTNIDDIINDDDNNETIVELNPESSNKNKSLDKGIILTLVLGSVFGVIFIFLRKRSKKLAKFFSSVVPETRNT